MLTTWENREKTILRWDFFPAWTWQTFVEAKLDIDRMAASVPHAVNLLLNLTGAPVQQVSRLPAFETLPPTTPTNIGQIVIVGYNDPDRALLYALSRLYDIHTRPLQLYDRLDAAYHALQAVLARAQ